MDGEQRYFGRFCLDLGRRVLLRDEKPVRLGGRALDILCVLASADGAVVSKDELMARVWPGVVVEENNLHVHISALRRVFAEADTGEVYLVTVPGRGYRLVGLQNMGQQATPLGDRPDALLVTPASQPLAVPRLPIVVLPFANLSDDRKQQYFAGGITEDLTTDLSRIANFFVISRNTAFTYRNKPIDTKHIGRELGVRYVLEGSVRRSGSQVRISAQLIDAITGAHLWAERFDRDTTDVFALQDEITGRIAVALNLELIGAEAARTAEHPDALDYILRGRAALSKPSSRENYTEAIRLFERALSLNPQSIDAQSLLAGARAGRVLDQMTDTALADVKEAKRLTRQALAASPRSPLAHFAKGLLLRAQNRFKEAIPEFEIAVESNRSWVNAIALLGQCKLLVGSFDEAVLLQEQAINLSPRDPHIGNFYWRIGLVLLLRSQTDQAITWLEKASSASPEHPLPHAYLASAYALRGDARRARAELLEAQELSGDGRYSSISRLKALGSFQVPKVRKLAETTFFAGLREAGVPER